MKNPLPKLATAGLLSLTLLATTAWAQTDSTAATNTNNATSTSGHAQKHADEVEQRIDALHAELKITDQQSTQWGALAQVMRDNAKKIAQAFHDHNQKMATASAPDIMTSYANLAKLHADNMQAMATAFNDLYNTMSPEQKQIADTLYRNQSLKHHAAKQKAKASPPAADAPSNGN